MLGRPLQRAGRGRDGLAFGAPSCPVRCPSGDGVGSPASPHILTPVPWFPGQTPWPCPEKRPLELCFCGTQTRLEGWPSWPSPSLGGDPGGIGGLHGAL